MVRSDLDASSARTVAPDQAVRDALNGIAVRLEIFHRSLTCPGPAASGEHRAALVETLGWFTGWTIPLALATAVRTPPR